MNFIMRPGDQVMALHELCNDLVDKFNQELNSIVEIGCYEGTSTRVFSQYARTVYAIDPFVPEYDPKDLASDPMRLAVAKQKFLEFIGSQSNIAFLNTFSHKAIKNSCFDQGVDVVYIDGNHTYKAVKKDLELWMPKANFAITGHDFKHHEAHDAIVEAIGKPDKVYSDMSWVKYK